SVGDGPVKLANPDFRLRGSFAIHIKNHARHAVGDLPLVESFEKRTRGPHGISLRQIAYSTVVQIIEDESQSSVLVRKVMDLGVHRLGAHFEGFKNGIHTPHPS